jgi:hypothetical protein
MKKILSIALLTALLALPLGVSAQPEESSSLPVAVSAGEVSGAVPAQTDAVEAVSPALHGAVLALLHQQDDQQTPVAWETVYNMVSMYGQLDERAEYQGDDLLLPSETVMDYASALYPDLSQLGPVPEELSDRLRYDPSSDSYLVVCGEDDLSQIEATVEAGDGGQLELSGALVYQVDGSELARFSATLTPADNMFGFVIQSFALE